MTKQQGAGSAGRRLIAWTLAYVLVLQLVLVSLFTASAFAASLDPGAANPFALLCLNGRPAAPTDEGAPAGGKGHCPLCLARVDAAVLPPPAPTPMLDRVAIEFRYRVVVRDSLRSTPHRRPQQPRAPPFFA